MAENSKGQDEKPWIPPNLAAVLYGPVPKSQLPPIDQMPPRELSNQQPQSRFAMKSTIEEVLARSRRSRSPPRPRSVMEPRSIKGARYRSMRSRSPLRRRNGLELKPMEDMRPQTKRQIEDLMEPVSVDKVQLTPRSIQEMQPQVRRSNGAFRPLIVMKSKSLDKTPTPGKVPPNVPKVSLKPLLKTISTPHTKNHSINKIAQDKHFIELQVMIWQWYGRIHANSNPNIIKIFRCFRPVLQNLTVRENPSERIPYFAISYKLPPIFYVCKLTFKIAKDLYEKEFQVIPMIKDDKQLTYFNEDRDIIALEDAQVLRDWRYNRQTEAEFTGMARMSLIRPASEKITRRINMKHLVIGGTDRSLIEARQLARFYDCESIMLGVPYLIRGRFFSTEDRSKPDHEAISTLRDRLLRFWKEERQGHFVRKDYRRKPIRSVLVEPSWDPTERTISNPMFFICTDGEILSQMHRLHPAITNFMTPLTEAKSSITFMNDMKFSHKHARLFEHPWKFISKK